MKAESSRTEPGRIERPDSAIFIHAWFRSSSTYIWSKLRQNESLLCYYEPLHESISGLTAASSAEAPNATFLRSMRHPALAEGYFREYGDLVRSGVLRGCQGLAYDRYLLQPDQPDDKLRDYFQTLLASAFWKNRRAALCFCRSQMRCGWMKQAFGGKHVAQIRNPIDQWKSFQVNPYFPRMLLVTALSLRAAFPAAFAHVPTFEAAAREITERRGSFSAAIPHSRLPPSELTAIFLLIWLASTWQAVACCDGVLDVDRIAADPDYRDECGRWFTSIGAPINLSDWASPSPVAAPFGASAFQRLLEQAAEAIRSNAAALLVGDPSAIAARLGTLSIRSRSFLEMAVGDGRT